jgi:HSP20 family molecular chaperone IbpA
VVTRIFFHRRDFDGDMQRSLAWLDDADGPDRADVEYRPPVDVVETAAAIDVIVDLPGVSASSVRVVVTGGTLVIAGRKGPPVCQHASATFHLAERSFGRFAYGLRVAVAIDDARATATLRSGELHVTLPRIDERRGSQREITIKSDGQ